MYSLSYKLNGQFKCELSTCWSDMFSQYAELARRENVTELCISDNEYGKEFRNWKWDTSSYLGWAGGEG